MEEKDPFQEFLNNLNLNNVLGEAADEIPSEVGASIQEQVLNACYYFTELTDRLVLDPQRDVLEDCLEEMYRRNKSSPPRPFDVTMKEGIDAMLVGIIRHMPLSPLQMARISFDFGRAYELISKQYIGGSDESG